MLRVADKLYYLGATDEDVAEALDISRETVFQWADSNPKFSDTRKKKELPDDEVERAMHKRATGYEVNGVHVPANPISQIFWLKNRRPTRWKDKQEVEHSGSINQQTPEQIMETLVQQAAAMPTKAYQIRKWAKQLLERIPAVEGE